MEFSSGLKGMALNLASWTYGLLAAFFFVFSVRCIIYRCFLGRSQHFFYLEEARGCKDLRVFFGQTPDTPQILRIFSFECAPIGKRAAKVLYSKSFFRV